MSVTRPIPFMLTASAVLVPTLVLLGAAAAEATVIQRSVVIFREHDTFNQLDAASDEIDVPLSTDVDRAVFATISDNGGLGVYDTTATVGRFGNVYVSGSQSSAGDMISQVFISSDEYVNLTARPQSVEANFIVDGGLFTLAFAPGASVNYQLALVDARIGGNRFVSNGELTSQMDGSIAFMTTGRDIGATFDGAANVQIPLGFYTLDLGVVDPGERLELEYLFTVRTRVPQFAEILEFEFSDPLNVDGEGHFPRPMNLVATPVIPEPGTALLLGFGLSLLTRQHPRRQSEASSSPIARNT